MTVQAQPRAAIYARVSSTTQEEGSSLDTQEERCRRYAVEQGYAVAEEHVYRCVCGHRQPMTCQTRSLRNSSWWRSGTTSATSPAKNCRSRRRRCLSMALIL